METNARELTAADIEAFRPEAKIGLLATFNEDGLPHITLLTSLMARGPRELMFGQFCEGKSKLHVRHNPRTAFAVLNARRDLWQGKATWTHSATEGDDFITLNNKPMFRYNTYFGIHTVHYLDLLEVRGPVPLSIPRMVTGAALSVLAAPVARLGGRGSAMTRWATAHIGRPDTLKFLAFAGVDGYPALVPVVPALATGSGRIVIPSAGRRQDLSSIARETPVALFAINQDTVSVLVRGHFTGLRHFGLVEAGAIDVDWVYNSMPPNFGQVFPPLPVAPVTNFGGPAA